MSVSSHPMLNICIANASNNYIQMSSASPCCSLVCACIMAQDFVTVLRCCQEKRNNGECYLSDIALLAKMQKFMVGPGRHGLESCLRACPDIDKDFPAKYRNNAVWFFLCCSEFGKRHYWRAMFPQGMLPKTFTEQVLFFRNILWPMVRMAHESDRQLALFRNPLDAPCHLFTSCLYRLVVNIFLTNDDCPALFRGLGMHSLQCAESILRLVSVEKNDGGVLLHDLHLRRIVYDAVVAKRQQVAKLLAPFVSRNVIEFVVLPFVGV